MEEINISKCTKYDFETIKDLIQEYELDNNDLHFEQFIIAKRESEVLGFGRIRNYLTCNEIASIGIKLSYRNKGLGSKITQELIKAAPKPLYLVSVIPHFFEPFGFKMITLIPEEIAAKMRYCRGSLPVARPYVAMQLV